MEILMNTLTKGLAGVLFVALLAVNVQIGSGNNLIATTDYSVSKAEAQLGCPWNVFEVCEWFEWPDGDINFVDGEKIVVTPEEKIAKQSN